MSETTRLKLFKHDNPSINTNPFDVQLALNENWDKIDEAQSEIIKHFNSIQEMKIDETLQAGDTCQTLGYYSTNDGGAGEYEIVDDDTLIDDGGSVLDLENGLKAKLIDTNYIINVKKFGAYGNGTYDDTLAFQNCIDKYNNIYIPIGTYKIDNSIEINENTRITGESMEDTTINFTDDTDYLFKYLTPVQSSKYNSKTNIELNNFKVNCKNFIKINDNTLSDSQWIYQGSLLHLMFENLWLIGIYDTITDNNKDTNVLPTLETLLDYGCGFNCNSIFDSAIVDCRIERFGIGVYFKGCDINRIEHNRINQNACHIFQDRVSTYGSQNRILHNDLLRNRRYGGIRINGGVFHTIDDNYFECYTPSACAIYCENERGISIINNRFDNPTQSDIDLIRLAPNNCDIVCNNRINPSGASNHCYLNILTQNLRLDSANNLMNLNSAVVYGNNTKLEMRNNAFVLNNDYNPLLISPYNVNYEYNMITGTRFIAPFVNLDQDENLYYFLDNTESGTTLSLRFKQLKKKYAKYPKIRFKYKSNEQTTMYAQIKGDDSTIYNTNISINGDNTIHIVDLDLTSNTQIYNLIRIDLPVKAGVKLYSVELI